MLQEGELVTKLILITDAFLQSNKKGELAHRNDRDVGTPETIGFAIPSSRKCKIQRKRRRKSKNDNPGQASCWCCFSSRCSKSS